MAFYDLSQPLDRENFKLRADALVKRGVCVELTEKRPPRTNQQNRYLYCILSYFGAVKGYTAEEVKTDFFKTACNADLFVVSTDYDALLMRKRVKLRSTSALTTEELTLAIERFRNWSASLDVDPLYIPSPDDHHGYLAMEREISRNREYL